jgi:hypothetical protein
VGDAATRLRAVLRTYALICRQHRRQGSDELAAVLRRSPQARKLQRQLLDLINGLVAEAAEAGVVRRDLSAGAMARLRGRGSGKGAAAPPDPAQTAPQVGRVRLTELQDVTSVRRHQLDIERALVGRTDTSHADDKWD